MHTRDSEKSLPKQLTYRQLSVRLCKLRRTDADFAKTPHPQTLDLGFSPCMYIARQIALTDNPGWP